MKPFESYPNALRWLMASILAVLVTGCGGGGGGDVSAPAPGTLGVSLTDAPACGFAQVNVTFVKVRVHQSSSASDTDAGWTDITLKPARKINLLDLNNGVLTSLGETPLPAGHYTQIRLVLDPNAGAGLANSAIPTGGAETALVTPSSVQSGIKLINQFDVASGQRVDLALDFDACKSVIKRGDGTYALNPVVKVVPFAANGIDGYIDTGLLHSNVMITAQQNGVIVQSTAPDTQTGKFFLSRLTPGNYDVVITADARAMAVITTVPVESGTSVVDLSNISMPITLPASATHSVSGWETLNPASSTTVAYVTARQTFGTTPTVTVKDVAIDGRGSPAYTLTLPVGAPQLGLYSTTLPISLVTQVGMSGRYTVEGSADGYVTQSVSKNISVADSIQNFVLVP